MKKLIKTQNIIIFIIILILLFVIIYYINKYFMHKNTVENYYQNSNDKSDCIKKNRNKYNMKDIVKHCTLKEGDDCSSYINDIISDSIDKDVKVEDGKCNHTFLFHEDKNDCMDYYDYRNKDFNEDHKIVRACKLENGDDCSIYKPHSLFSTNSIVQNRECVSNYEYNNEDDDADDEDTLAYFYQQVIDGDKSTSFKNPGL